MKFFWVCTLLASILAGAVLAFGLLMAKGAPQEAATAGVALCLAVIPYVFTRAIEGVAAATWREKMLRATESSGADYKSGVQSLWQQLDAIRAQGVPASQPQPSQVELQSASR